MSYRLRGFGDAAVLPVGTDANGNCLPGYIALGLMSNSCQPFSPSDALNGALSWAAPSTWGTMFSRKDPYQIAGFLAVPALIYWLFFRGGR